MTSSQFDLAWNNDGHTLTLQINKTDLDILQVNCPGDGPCITRHGCVVKYFVERYGFECNIGVCAPEETLEICWALVGDTYDLEVSQLWFVPVKDDVFYAWMSSRA